MLSCTRPFVFLFLLFGSLFCSTPVLAVWAEHEVVQAGEGQDALQLSVKVSEENQKEVEIFLPFEKPKKRKMSKGYFLIIATERLPKESLEFRSEMIVWPSHLESRKQIEKFPELKAQMKPLQGKVQKIEHIEPLVWEKRGEQKGIFVTLTREQAMRSYLVYDFKPWGGGMVMDGGLWVTYDLPTFVEKTVAPAGKPESP